MLRTPIEKESRAIAIALALLLAAIFMPTLKLPRDTYTYIIFLDITQSMNVEDYELDGLPVSRLAYARQAVRRALHDLPCGSRIGLGAFAEYRTLLLLAPIEVCDNYGDLLASLNNVDGRMRWHDSSEIAKGVFWSIRAAKEVGENTNVVFLTDGQEAPPLGSSEQPIFEDVKRGEIGGWLVGVGSYTPRPIPRTDREGKPLGYWRAEDVVQLSGDSVQGSANRSREHLSALGESHLKALAAQVGFEYAHLAGLSSISEVMRDPQFTRERSVPTNVYWLPAAAALIVLALRFRPDIGSTKQSRGTGNASAGVESQSQDYSEVPR